MTRIITVICSLLLFAGCSKKKAEQKSKEPSLTQTLIDGATGRTAVRQGRNAQKKIIEASKKKDDELNEVLGK